MKQPVLILVLLALATPLPCLGQSSAPGAIKSFSTEVTKTDYTLGPGDGLQILFFNVTELSGPKIVLPDGTVSLPLLGSVRVEGLTADQLSERLSELYRPYLVKSQISVTIERPRPVTITLSGEVNRPGPYTTQPVQAVAAAGAAPGVITNRINVSSVITQAGGLTERASVRNITLTRQLPDGQTSKRNIDLWALLQDGDIKQNPVLQDGDVLVIPRAEGPQEGVSYDVVAQSVLSPEQIEVQVIGEVIKPGPIKLRSNAPMTSALVSAGGLTNIADPTAVELIRMNRDGTITRRLVSARLEQPTDEKLNPPLRQADMLVVRRSFGGQLITDIGTALNPFAQIANVLVLFRALR
ncbi:MAG: SLBB domain-containing protein [Gemmatimonadaceae bacterium]|nr:SLBB domain-containing protein [Gloeobacterales cyanobacterium ES-bin-141]